MDTVRGAAGVGVVGAELDGLVTLDCLAGLDEGLAQGEGDRFGAAGRWVALRNLVCVAPAATAGMNLSLYEIGTARQGGR